MPWCNVSGQNVFILSIAGRLIADCIYQNNNFNFSWSVTLPPVLFSCVFACGIISPSLSGNGSEFISSDLDLQALQKDILLDFSRPGKPTDNTYFLRRGNRFTGSIACPSSRSTASSGQSRKMENWRREQRSPPTQRDRIQRPDCIGKSRWRNQSESVMATGKRHFAPIQGSVPEQKHQKLPVKPEARWVSGIRGPLPRAPFSPCSVKRQGRHFCATLDLATSATSTGCGK